MTYVPTKWYATANGEYPVHNQEVVVLRPSGDSQIMKYSNNLWFLGPDFEVYTYFVPPFWRPLIEGER